LKKKKLKVNKLNKELFNLTKYENIFELSSDWLKLLSKAKGSYLCNLLENVVSANQLDNEVILRFKSKNSLELFKRAMSIEKSRKQIESVFKSIYGLNIRILVQKNHF
jgi:hypothetical protein